MYAFAPGVGGRARDWGADVIKVVPPLQPRSHDGNFRRRPTREGRGRGIHVGDHEPGQALHRRSTSRPMRGENYCSSWSREADVFITNLLPGRRRRFRSTPRTSSPSMPGLVYGRASGHGVRRAERASEAMTTPISGPEPGSVTQPAWSPDEFAPQLGPSHRVTSRPGPSSPAPSRPPCTVRSVPAVARSSTSRSVGAGHVDGGAGRRGQPAVWRRATSTRYATRRSSPMQWWRPMPPATAVWSTSPGSRPKSHFENFCEVIGRKDLLDDPRFATGTRPPGPHAESASACSTRSLQPETSRSGQRSSSGCPHRGRS